MVPVPFNIEQTYAPLAGSCGNSWDGKHELGMQYPKMFGNGVLYPIQKTKKEEVAKLGTTEI